jgi:hypothetical protein
VKIHFKIIRKRYKKKLYEYEQAYMNFPKELNDFLRCLRDRELEIKASREGKTTHITLVEVEEL